MRQSPSIGGELPPCSPPESRGRRYWNSQVRSGRGPSLAIAATNASRLSHRLSIHHAVETTTRSNKIPPALQDLGEYARIVKVKELTDLHPITASSVAQCRGTGIRLLADPQTVFCVHTELRLSDAGRRLNLQSPCPVGDHVRSCRLPGVLRRRACSHRARSRNSASMPRRVALPGSQRTGPLAQVVP